MSKEFWERCGFRFKLSASENPHYWIDPNGHAVSELPEPTLENLFKYAVPIATEELGYHIETHTYARKVGDTMGKCSWVKITKDGDLIACYALEHLKDSLYKALNKAFGLEG